MDAFTDDQNDSLEITLRDPGTVATRLVILAAFCHRAFIEVEAAETENLDLDEERFDLLAWLYDQNLFAQTSDQEGYAFQAPIGTLSADEALAATWSAEAIMALCWSLGLIPELPSFDQLAPIQSLLDLIPEPGSSSLRFRNEAKLLGEDHIAAAREAAELWYWRATMQEMLDDAAGKERDELLSVIGGTAAEGASLALLPHPVGDDFPVHGGAYAHSSDHESLAAIAEWRLRALNWLCGFGESWDDVELDV